MAHRLEKMGIKKIEGDLIIVGDWQMNYKTNAQQSARLFRQALNSQEWTTTIEKTISKPFRKYRASGNYHNGKKQLLPMKFPVTPNYY